MDEVKEIAKRDSSKERILRNALPDPDQLEFKVVPLEAADMDVDYDWGLCSWARCDP